MNIARDRFDETEDRLLAEALDTDNLWPYGRGGSAPFIGKALDMVQAHFEIPGRKAYVIPTASGTASIHVALGGLQIPAGSEVILPPITDPGTVTPIIFCNAIPVFADVSPTSGLITPDGVADALTPRTSAVIIVHLTGSPADVPGIRKRLEGLGRSDVKVIEDVAQGLGASLNGIPLGMMGDASCFSLNSQKHITVGEGGFVLVNDADDFYRCHNFSDKHRDRFKGGRNKAEHDRYQGVGHSLRMSELQGAMLQAQLPKLERLAGARTAFGLAMDARLKANSGLTPQSHLDGAVPTFFGYMFAAQNEYSEDDKRDAILQIIGRLQHLGMSMGRSYNQNDLPIYKYPFFLKRNFSQGAGDIWPAELVAGHLYPGDVSPGFYDYSKVSCPHAESYLKRSFWVRLHEGNTPAHAEEIADVIVDVFNERGMS